MNTDEAIEEFTQKHNRIRRIVLAIYSVMFVGVAVIYLTGPLPIIAIPCAWFSGWTWTQRSAFK